MASFGLSEELAQVQSTVNAFASDVLRPQLRAAEKNGLPAAVASQFAELGLHAADWPEAAGGSAMGALTRAIIEEALSFGDVGLAFALDSGGAAAQFLLALGTS